MRRNSALLGYCLFVSLMIATGVSAQQAPGPSTPPGPGGGRISSGTIVMVGPNDEMGQPRRIHGRTRIICRLPQGTQPAGIDILIDNKPVGSATKRNVIFTMEYDASALSEGEHTIKAIGKDASGKEVWSASTKVTASSSNQPSERRPSAPGAQLPPPRVMPGRVEGNAPNGDLPVVTTPPADAPSADAPPVAETTQPPSNDNKAPAAAKPDSGSKSPDVELSGELKNEAKGFQIRYPGKWTVKDETAKIKPKESGAWWIVLSSSSGAKSPLVVNIRRRQLEPGSDADTFAKYESFVLKWERRTLLGSTAFATTTGTPKSKRVIHRLILVKDGVAWMLNCTDLTGKPAAESKKIFDAMVNSIQITSSAQPKVTVKEKP